MTAADVRRWTRRVLPWLCVATVIVWSARSETARDQARVSFGAAVLTVLVILALIAWCWSLDGDSQRQDDNQRQIDRVLRSHDEQLANLHRDLTALCDFLNVDVLPPVVDDSPGREEQGTPTAPYPQVNPEEQPATSPDLPAQKPSPRPRDEPADTVESHAVLVGGMRLGPAAQKAADDLERMIAEIRMRTAERNAQRPQAQEDEAHGAA